MRRIAFIALACLGIAACSPTSTGPIGAVVGGTVGAVAGGSTGAATEAQGRRMAMASPGRCYVYDELGNQAIDRRGRPITTRC
jgi:hypothetical protein